MIFLLLASLLAVVPSSWSAIHRPEIHTWLEQNSYICVLDPLRNSVQFLTTGEARTLSCNCGDPLITESACARKGNERPHCRRLPDLCMREYQILFTEVEDRRNQPMSTRQSSIRTTTTQLPTTQRRRISTLHTTKLLRPLPTFTTRNPFTRSKPTFTLANRFPFTTAGKISSNDLRKFTPTTPSLLRSRPTFRTTFSGRKSTLHTFTGLHRDEQVETLPSTLSRSTQSTTLSTTPETTPSTTSSTTTTTTTTTSTTPKPITTTTILISTTPAPASTVASTLTTVPSLTTKPTTSTLNLTTFSQTSDDSHVPQTETKREKLEKVRSLIKELLQNMSPEDHINDLEQLFDFEQLRSRHGVRHSTKDPLQKHKPHKEIVRVSSEEVPAETGTRMQRVVFDEQMNLMGDAPSLVLTTNPASAQTTTDATTTTLPTSTAASAVQSTLPASSTLSKENSKFEPIIEKLLQRIDLLEAKVLHTVATPGSKEELAHNNMLHNFKRQMIDFVRRQENDKAINAQKKIEAENELTAEDLSNLRSTTAEVLNLKVTKIRNGEDEEPTSVSASMNDQPTTFSPRIRFTTSKFNAKICEDNHPLCEYWAFYKQCSVNAKYMYKYCRKACGICDFRRI